LIVSCGSEDVLQQPDILYLNLEDLLAIADVAPCKTSVLLTYVLNFNN